MNILNKLFLSAAVMLVFSGCRKTLQQEVMVYQNGFETNDLRQTAGVVIHSFNGNQMAGSYNKSGFNVELEGLQSHDYLKVSFDLYIHDYWDGNNTGNQEVVTGADIWSMSVNKEAIIYTTFSSTVCNTNYCLLQSYPQNYPKQNDPGTGVVSTLPGLCAAGGVTKVYHIEKLIRHDNSWALISFEDQLHQSNVIDQKCDESWSLDNLKISIINSD